MPFHRADYDERCVMLYGHVHNTREYTMLESFCKEIKSACTECQHAHGQFVNVGCMMPWMDYRPQPLEVMLEKASTTYKPWEKENEE